MKTSTIIIGIILFAIATMIIYSWGLIKQKSQTGDLMNLLFSKGERQIKKYLKDNDYITTADVERMCEGMEAKLPFSGNRAVVKNKKDYAMKLLTYMVKTDQLVQEGSRFKKVKK